VSHFIKRSHEVPALNMASMPDLIFTVLFFFMIVTHMRSVPLKVVYQVPAGTELTKLTKKSSTTYIYIGKPLGQKDAKTSIQLNDKIAPAEQVTPYVVAERKRMLPEDARNMTVDIKADRHADMGTITDVKQALRQGQAYRIHYSAVSR
jgi:biopolymer transport protein ExbD